MTLPFKYQGKDQDKLNRNKCFECKTDGGTEPCNGGIVPHKAFWLLLLIGGKLWHVIVFHLLILASVPWFVLPMMGMTMVGV